MIEAPGVVIVHHRRETASDSDDHVLPLLLVNKLANATRFSSSDLGKPAWSRQRFEGHSLTHVTTPTTLSFTPSVTPMNRSGITETLDQSRVGDHKHRR